jgi:hypothetical protein
MKIKHSHINVKHIKDWVGFDHMVMLLNIETFKAKYSLQNQLNSPKHTHNNNNKIIFATNTLTWYPSNLFWQNEKIKKTSIIWNQN